MSKQDCHIIYATQCKNGCGLIRFPLEFTRVNEVDKKKDVRCGNCGKINRAEKVDHE